MKQWSPDEREAGTLKFMVVVKIPKLIFLNKNMFYYLPYLYDSDLHVMPIK